MLDRIRKRAGKVRDLDVQLAALRSLKVPQEPRRKTQLMQGLIELRAKHEKRLRKMLDKEAVREITKRLRRGSKQVRSEASRDPLTVARTMLAQVARPAGPVTEDVLHQYRIVVKRARYAAEFAPKSAEATQFIGQLKQLQDAVGNWHDWLTLTQSRSQAAGRRQPIVAGGGAAQRDERQIPPGSRCAFGVAGNSGANDRDSDHPACAEGSVHGFGTIVQSGHETSHSGGADGHCRIAARCDPYSRHLRGVLSLHTGRASLDGQPEAAVPTCRGTSEPGDDLAASM